MKGARNEILLVREPIGMTARILSVRLVNYYLRHGKSPDEQELIPTEFYG